MNDSKVDFTLSRSFDAPLSKMWDAWTDNEKLKQWFGPKECPIFFCKMDLKAGGVFLYGMKTPDGQEMWGRWIFKEVTPPKRLTTVVSFSDPDGGVTRHPWSALWPLETLGQMDFTEENGKTTITILWRPLNARPEEVNTFAEGHASMAQGWGGTMDQLDAFLAKG